jgi:hypothetical protein
MMLDDAASLMQDADAVIDASMEFAGPAADIDTCGFGRRGFLVLLER